MTWRRLLKELLPDNAVKHPVLKPVCMWADSQKVPSQNHHSHLGDEKEVNVI